MTPSALPFPQRARAWFFRAGPLLGLVAVYTLFASLQFDRFVDGNNTVIMLQQTAVTGIGALGMTLIIISGGIDLAAGSIIACVCVVIALLLKAGWSAWAAAAAGIGLGALAGLVNGMLVTRLKLMPFIVTLGTMGILRGAAKRLADDQAVYPDESPLNALMLLPERGLPAGVWWLLVLSVLCSLLLRYTKFGRHIFAIGSNEATARLCGIRVDATKVAVYTLGATLAGIAGLMQFSYLTVGDPTTAIGLELNIIAAVVIGGASLAGGSGTILGTLVGALIITVVNNGCTKLDMPNSVQEIVTGVIIIGAVTLDRLRSGTKT